MSKPLSVKVWGHLVSEVLRTGLCMYCGACIAVCPVNVLHHSGVEKPVIKGRCILCGICYYCCPRVQLDVDLIEKRLFGRTRSLEEKYIGIVSSSFAARSTDEEILKICQDGGVTTSLLIHALNIGFVDQVVVTGAKDMWQTVPLVASSHDEVLKASGSKYTLAGTISGVADAVLNKPDSKLAFVGLPCQVEGLRRMSSSSRGHWKLAEHVTLIIGLFCNYSYQYKGLVLEFLQKQHKIDLSKVTKMDIKKKRLRLYEDHEAIFENSIRDLDHYTVSGCHKCQDYTAELADISIGAVGSPPGWCTVLVRSRVGDELIKSASGSGILDYKPLKLSPEIGIVAKISEEKKKREAPYIVHQA